MADNGPPPVGNREPPTPLRRPAGRSSNNGTRLRRQGERYFADGLRKLPHDHRLAILAVCAVEWGMFLADAVVETHDRHDGRTYRETARACEATARGRDGRGPRGAPGNSPSWGRR